MNFEDWIERWAESVPVLAKQTVKNALLIAFAVLYVVFWIGLLILGAFLLSKVPFMLREDVQDCGTWLWVIFGGLDLLVCSPLKNRFGGNFGFQCLSNVVKAGWIVAFLIRCAGWFAGVG